MNLPVLFWVRLNTDSYACASSPSNCQGKKLPNRSSLLMLVYWVTVRFTASLKSSTFKIWFLEPTSNGSPTRAFSVP